MSMWQVGCSTKTGISSPNLAVPVLWREGREVPSVHEVPAKLNLVYVLDLQKRGRDTPEARDAGFATRANKAHTSALVAESVWQHTYTTVERLDHVGSACQYWCRALP